MADFTVIGIQFCFVFAVLFAVVVAVGHECEANQASGNDAGAEEFGRRGTCCSRVNDVRDAGRDDDAETAGDGDDRCGKDQIIAHFHEERNCHGSDCRDCRGRGAGDRCVEHTGHDDSTGEASCFIADEIGKEIEELFGDAALCHDHAGDHEHGDCKEGKAVHAGEHRSCHIRSREGERWIHEARQQGHQPEYTADGECDNKQRRKKDKE